MTPNDMVYNAVYKGCLKIGCVEQTAKAQAVIALGMYKKNQFTTASKLIDQQIKECKKMQPKKIPTKR